MDPNEEEEISSSNTKTKKIPNYPGPKEGVSYPITVLYCGGNLNRQKFRVYMFFL